MRTRSKTKKIRKYLLQDQIRDKENPLISIWIRHEKSGHKHGFRMRLGTKMHKLFNAWCYMFGGGKPVTAFRFFFKGKLIDGEQTAADIDIRRAIDLDVADYINVTSLPEVTLPITRSNSKKIRENVRRLPHEVEATLPSWVKCTDPIPREILEEVRSTVMTWIKNVRNYVFETELKILYGGLVGQHAPPEIVDDGWAFFVDRILCLDPLIQGGFPHNTARFDYAEGVGRYAASGQAVKLLGLSPATGPYRGKVIHTGWSRFIRRMILSDVNIIHRQPNAADGRARAFDGFESSAEDFEVTDIFVGSREENASRRGMLRLTVQFHDRLSSEIKDEICSKLESAVRALKSRISRICGINELERRTVPSQNKHESTYIHDLRNDQNY